MKYVDTKDQISEEKTRLNGGQTAKGQRQTAKDQKSYELIHLILCKKDYKFYLSEINKTIELFSPYVSVLF